jgi:hypothetical protein
MSNSLDKLISKDELLTYLCLTIGIINIIYIFIIMINDIKHNMALILLFEFLFLIFIISFLLKKRDVYNKDDDIKYDWYFYLRISIIIIAFLCFVIYIKYLLIDSAINKKQGGAGTTSRFNSSNFFGSIKSFYYKFTNEKKYLEDKLNKLNKKLQSITDLKDKIRENTNIATIIEEQIKNLKRLQDFNRIFSVPILNHEEKALNTQKKYQDKLNKSNSDVINLTQKIDNFKKQYPNINIKSLISQEQNIKNEINIIKQKIIILEQKKLEKLRSKSSNKIHPEQTLVETSQLRDTANASRRLSTSNTSETQSVSNRITQKELPPLNVSNRGRLSLIEKTPFESSQISPISPQSQRSPLDILSPKELEELQKNNDNIMYTFLTRQSSKLPPVDDEMLSELSILSPPTLENRIDIYNIVNKKLKKIKHNECLNNVKNSKVLGDILTLNKYVLSEGQAGKVYISKVKDTHFEVVLKLMKREQDNINETKIMKNITEQILLKKHSKHFTLFYNSYECKTTYDDSSLISVSELAEGDLDKLLKSSEFFDNVDDAVNNLYNLLVQCIVSLGTFHNFGYIHNDSHLKNFLYQTNNDYEEGYYRYKYKDKTFYIKSCRYNIMLGDFGLSGFTQTANMAERQAEDMIIILQSIIYFYINNKDFSEKIKTDKKFLDFIMNVEDILNYLLTNKSKYNFTDLLNMLCTFVPSDILSLTIDESSSNILNNPDFDMTIKDSDIK